MVEKIFFIYTPNRNTNGTAVIVDLAFFFFIIIVINSLGEKEKRFRSGGIFDQKFNKWQLRACVCVLTRFLHSNTSNNNNYGEMCFFCSSFHEFFLLMIYEALY